MNDQTWKCRRCGSIVDMVAMRCDCTESPSPWEPINEEKCENCGCEIHPCMPCEEVVMLNGNHTDYEYLKLLDDIMRNGRVKKNRTGVNTIGVFGRQAKFDVCMNAFPILTTKKVHFKSIVHELLWFIKGDTNIKYLVDNGVNIWNEWAYAKHVKIHGKEFGLTFASFIDLIKIDAEIAKEWGELGKGTYGGMWRDFPVDDVSKTGSRHTLGVDQLKTVIEKLKTNPDDRRMIVSAWHPYWVDHCALPPCHVLFHFNTEELTTRERYDIYTSRGGNCGWTSVSEMNEKVVNDADIPRRRINLLLYQRSLDLPVGGPFNISSYCLMLCMVAQCVNMLPGVFTWSTGDTHIYENQLPMVKEQLTRTPKMLPTLWLNPNIKDLFSFTYEDIKLIGYDPHPAIKMPVAV